MTVQISLDHDVRSKVGDILNLIIIMGFGHRQSPLGHKVKPITIRATSHVIVISHNSYFFIYTRFAHDNHKN